MSSKKQTAVEWLADQIECFGNKHELQMSWATLDDLFEQAKAIEKKQIIDAYHINPKETKWDNKGIEYYKEAYDK
jgi:hypothetical protein